MRVAEQLDFHVTRPDQASLEIHVRVAKCRAGLRARRRAPRRELRRIGDRAHPLAAATCHRLDEQRIANRVGRASQCPRRTRPASSGVVRAGHHRHAGAHRCLASGGLAAHQRHCLRRRSDERQRRIADRSPQTSSFSARNP